MSSDKISPAQTTVMLLAAGRGQRMQSLTADTPKPLLKVGEASLIEHHLLKLSQLGFENIVINLAYLGNKIRQQLGNGCDFSLNIEYSDEFEHGALETAGGIHFALDKINSDPFLVVNADIWTDYPFAQLLGTPLNGLGRLVLVNNPEHNPEGDFSIDANGKLIDKQARDNYTFSGIALYKKALFADLSKGKQALAPLFHQQLKQQTLEAVHYSGEWIDIGTPERLQQINQALQ